MIRLFTSLYGSLANLFSISFLILLVSCTDQSVDEDYDDPYSSSKLKPQITRLILVDANTQQDIGDLISSMSFNSLPVSIRADAQATSVVFQVSGAETFTQTETTLPFTLKGDNAGVYNKWIPTGGDYTLTVTPYAMKDGKGMPGIPVTVNFKVIGTSTIVAPPSLTSTTTALPLYFEGNFSNATVDRNKIYGWTAFEALPELTAAGFAWSGAESYVNASIRTDNGVKVLYAEVNDDDPAQSGQSRFQWTMFLKSKLEIIHFQYKLYLSPDIADLNNYTNSFNWFSIFEMWNERAPDLSAIGIYDGASRWNLNIHKDATGSLYWAWATEYMQPKEMAFMHMYPIQKNRTAEIPLGRWFTLDIYFNRNGKTIVKADNNVIFDFVGQNVYPGRAELYPAYNQSGLNAFKLYTSDALLDFLRPRGKKIWAMYNDFKWFKS